MPPIIEVRNLSKRYKLGAIGATSLRDEIARFFGKSGERSRASDFMALSDVSFDVQRGEVLGIIGRNGAGKSTLLKILARITQQTSGEIVLRGRVASLLEVGTGFHPELSGRDNIFLNGAILGMRKAEIRAKFDEIVAFADVDRFIDTPVKRYSSGMYVRLAFAVAAHLEPEILLVDEVLAVGDAQFQKKCLGKMQDVASRGGRTVLFVSHNLSTVHSLCTRAILLDRGRLVLAGSPDAVIGRYVSADTLRTGVWRRDGRAAPSEGVYFEEILLSVADGIPAADFRSDHRICFRLSMIALNRCENVQISVRFFNQQGMSVFTTANTDEARRYVPIPSGRIVFSFSVPPDFLPQGQYLLQIVAHVPHDRVMDIVDGEVGFSIHDVGSHATVLKDGRYGVVTPLFPWRMEGACAS